jgi:hypothetical protein
VDPVPDPFSENVVRPGIETRDLWICIQKLWPVVHRGGKMNTETVKHCHNLRVYVANSSDTMLIIYQSTKCLILKDRNLWSPPWKPETSFIVLSFLSSLLLIFFLSITNSSWATTTLIKYCSYNTLMKTRVSSGGVILVYFHFWNTRVVEVVEALCYKPKRAGVIPDEITGFFSWPNPSSRTLALGSTQLLTEMSTRNLCGGWRAAGA